MLQAQKQSENSAATGEDVVQVQMSTQLLRAQLRLLTERVGS